MDYRDEIRDIAQKLTELSLIDLQDIPRIDLYMEQVTTFFEDELGDVRRNGDEKILTKTMINNYTKSGILAPPVKKKYNRDHIIALVYIFLLKPVLAIQDIKDLFALLPKSCDSEKTAALYSVVGRMVGEYSQNSADRMEERLDQAEGMLREAGLSDPRYSVLLLSLLLSIEATAHRLTVGRLLDHFRDRDWEKKEEQEELK